MKVILVKEKFSDGDETKAWNGKDGTVGQC